MQPHYVYSPRELTRWVRGMFEAIRPLENLTVDMLVRVWAHEVGPASKLRMHWSFLTNPDSAGS